MKCGLRSKTLPIYCPARSAGPIGVPGQAVHRMAESLWKTSIFRVHPAKK